MLIGLMGVRQLEEIDDAVLGSHHRPLPAGYSSKADTVEHRALAHVTHFEARAHIWQIEAPRWHGVCYFTGRLKCDSVSFG
jgi:hypothetical protein